MFEHIAGLIEDQSAIVETQFGPGSTLIVLKDLQIQSDIQATKILDVFVDHFAVSRMVRKVELFSKTDHQIFLGRWTTEKPMISTLEKICSRFFPISVNFVRRTFREFYPIMKRGDNKLTREGRMFGVGNSAS